VSLVSETRNASDVQPRSITHFRDSWNGIWKIGDRTREKALDVSTIDEVPDSSWFENRIATRPMTTSEIAAGPNRTPPSGPWTVTSGKTEGITPGLQMKDSTGQLYFVKFDPPAYPELGTGAEVISTKLLYAAGYHVPQNFIVIVGREEMQIAPNAPLRGSDGKAHPMTGRDLDALLTQSARRPDGRYRVLASQALAGTPLGPFSYFGVRPDDPNDTIPHEHRRSLRGLRVFAAWLNHVDVKSENSLDTLISNDRGLNVVWHHLIDFNATLGSSGIGPADRRSGYEYILDGRQIFLSIVSLGTYVRPWLTIHYPDLPAVGRFESEHFEPARWKPTFPNRAMLNAQPDDTFWAARRVMAFSNEAIRAVVASADYSDARASQAIGDALIARRDKIGREWLAGMNPVTGFAVADDGTLTFENDAVSDGLSAPPVAYRIQWFRFDNGDGVMTPAGAVVTTAQPRASVPEELRGSVSFIAADVSAVDPQHAAWQEPVRVFFRRVEQHWTLIGVERS